MLAKDQKPVDILKTSVSLLNNLEGMIPILILAVLINEFEKLPAAVAALDWIGWAEISASSVVGLGISYTGIWAQSMISATSFLVLVNANKFGIIFIEAFIMQSKHVNVVQIAGATITIAGAVLYGKARERLEESAEKAIGLFSVIFYLLLFVVGD